MSSSIGLYELQYSIKEILKDLWGGFFMKKVLLPLALLLTFSIGTACAAPISTLERDQTAAGILLHTDNNSFYIENKVTDTMTVGYEHLNVESADATDLYAQFDLNEGTRGIMGFRDINSSSKAYAGLAFDRSLTPEWSGYGSIIAGNKFTEFQVGASYIITENLDLNLNYRAFNYYGYKDVGTIGAIYRF